MKKNIFLSPFILLFLFIGCGGTSSSSGNDTFKIVLDSTIYKVVENMKKDVRLISNRENVTYKFVDKTEAPDTELDKNRGVITFRATIGGVGSVHKVVVKAIDANGKESKPLTLSFQIVSSSISPTKQIIKTGATDGGIGIDRNFQKDGDYIVDAFGHTWEGKLENKALESSYYIYAKTRCEFLRLMNKGSSWRVPTADEMLNLINYSKESGSSMLDDIFDTNNSQALWVESEKNNYRVISPSNGIISKVDSLLKYPVRCINAPKIEEEHIVSTDRFNNKDTFDFSTGLKWSPISTERYNIESNASGYCRQYNNGSGWRLPSINEARSIVENGTISSHILGNNSIILSSTPYNNSDKSSKSSHYTLSVVNGLFSLGVSYDDVLFSITCVKEIR